MYYSRYSRRPFYGGFEKRRATPPSRGLGCPPIYPRPFRVSISISAIC
jgi:hypothetical protein